MDYFSDSFTADEVYNEMRFRDLSLRHMQPQLMKSWAAAFESEVRKARANQKVSLIVDRRLSDTSVATLMDELRDKGWNPVLSDNHISVMSTVRRI